MLNVFPKKSLCLVILFASTALTACGGGGGSSSSGFTVTTDTKSGTLPQIRPFVPDPTVPGFDASATEYVDTPTLRRMGLTPFYATGLSGSGISVGVLDSGIDGDHEELDGRVSGGGDWQGNGQGVIDPFGHGTHVASIIAAARNQRGIHGVAPYADLVSYRILNADGKFGSQSGNDMVPAILGNARSRGLPVINNSWASIYEINDIPKSSLDQILRQELQSYFQLAQVNGPMMVWAAGNDSDDQVSIRSGLPYHYPGLRQNWLTVVAADNNLREPRYTNRCGVAQAWCITAPGGGDDQYSAGIYAAIPDDQYSRKSGTSMAAPFVSGSIALLLEQFPGMTPRQAAARLLATATYDGLVTADGCTITTCTEAQMANVFGQGLINLPDALDPIGATSIEVTPYVKMSLKQSVLVTPNVLGGSVRNALADQSIIVRDSFDNAAFMLALDTYILPSPLRYATGYNGIKARHGEHLAQSGFRFAEQGSIPLSAYLPARLTDPSYSSDGNWVGYEHISGDSRQQIFFSQGKNRSVVHGVISQYQHNTQRWMGVGFDHQQGWVDGYAKGAFDTASASLWGFAGIRQQYEMVTLAAEAMIGQTRLNPKANSLITSGQYQYDALRLSATVDIGHATRLHLDLLLPPAVQSGQIQFRLPSQIDVGTGKTHYKHAHADLNLNDRERRVDVMMKHLWSENTQFYAGLGYRMNDGHRKGETAELITIGMNKTF